MSIKIKGIGVSKGISISKVYKLVEIDLNFEKIKDIDVALEKDKLNNSIDKSLKQLDKLRILSQDKLSVEELKIFEAHQLIIQDQDFLKQINEKIENEKIDAASSILAVSNSFIQIFETIDDDYFKERSADIKDVRKRLIANTLGLDIPDLTAIDQEVILVAEDLTPSETSQLNKQFVLGFATNIGGRTSHSAIMARSLEVPAIVGSKTIVESVENGDQIIIDGQTGDIIVNPNEVEIEIYTAKKIQFEANEKLLQKYKNKATISQDNYKTEICSNIGSFNDIDGVINNGSEGVGLYRSEFLYMESKELPTEEVQFEAYKKVLEAMKDKLVVVRTLDIGGDKELDYFDIPKEMNPFLGYRAIRLCLDQDQIFRVQLRALIRASKFGNLKIMFPMIATVEEFRDSKRIFEEEKAKLMNEGIEVAPNIELGIMVEIPSVAMMADIFAKEVDFFSIGTNDLIQYTMACDRMNEKVSYLYQPHNPAILRMVKQVIDASHKNNIWTGMCGEMASDPISIPILLGMGLDEFSMSSSEILSSRHQIASLNQKDIESQIDHILNLATAQDVKEYVETNILNK